MGAEFASPGNRLRHRARLSTAASRSARLTRDGNRATYGPDRGVCGARGHPRRRSIGRRLRRRGGALEGGRRAGEHRAGRLGHSPRPRPQRRGRGVRRDLRSGGGRLRAHRGQLSGSPRAHGGGARGGGDLGRPAHAPLHRSAGAEGGLCFEPAVAEGADGRLGGRPELLSRDPPRGPPEGLDPVRAVDGAELHRGQHRRRCREDPAFRSPGLLRQCAAHTRTLPAGRPGREQRRAFPRARRLQRHRHRAVRQRRRSRAAADKSSYLLLLPF